MRTRIAPQWQAMRCTPFLGLLCLAVLGIEGCALDVRGNRYDETLTGSGGGNGQGGGNPGVGGSAGGAQTSSSSSSGSLPEPESECSDGLDNDSDGVSDCEDSDCISDGYACIEDIPANAELVYLSGSADGCAAPWEPLSLIACKGCSCDIPSITCTVNSQSYSMAACGSYQGALPSTQSECIDISNKSRHLIVSASPPANFACAPPNPLLPASTISLCAAGKSSACGSQGLCLPKPAVPLCALFDGDIACPSPFSDRQAVFKDAADGVNCQCSCTTSNTGCEPGETRIYDTSDSCSGSFTSIPTDGLCHDSGYGMSQEFFGVAATATCGASAAPQSPAAAAQTLCCMP